MSNNQPHNQPRLWQDLDRTVPALKDGDPVAVWEPATGSDLVAVRSESAPVIRQGADDEELTPSSTGLLDPAPDMTLAPSVASWSAWMWCDPARTTSP